MESEVRLIAYAWPGDGEALSIGCGTGQHEGALPESMAAAVLPTLQRHPSASKALEVKTECVIYDIAKFIRLCTNANPSALEILFADERGRPWAKIRLFSVG